MTIEVKLPELGSGIDSADVLKVLVAEGDRVRKDQGIIEIETEKATVEVPTPYEGIVRRVLVQRGQSIKPGSVLITLEPLTEPAGARPGAAPAGPPPPPPPTEGKGQPESPLHAARPTSTGAARPGSRRVEEPAVAPSVSAGVSLPPTTYPTDVSPAPPVASAVPAAGEPSVEVEQVSPTFEGPASTATGVIPAGPAVRRFAREVGVDLRRVRGTGPGGRITREDVLAVVRAASQALAAKSGTTSDDWGPIRTERLSKIRRTIAEKMHLSWTTVPRVTNFDDADITELERIRQASKEDYARKGIKLTTLPFVIKAVAMTLRQHPLLNASIDLEHDRIIYKEYIHIGIAVDSERGLVVPVLRNADTRSIAEIARMVAELAEKVRTGDYTLDDLRGGSFTISNLGAIGGTYSTPIVNVPEVAILLVGRSRKMPVVVDDQIVVRLMLPLSLSYDHRLVDGAAAARFLNDVIAYLETPSRLLLAP